MSKTTPQFPQTLHAARRLDAAEELSVRISCKRRFALGDALIAEVGPPGDNGVRTGTDDLIRKAADVLKAQGLKKYNFDHLRDLRRTAWDFPAVTRSPAGLSWSVFHAAGTPEDLKKVLRYARSHPKFKISARSVEAFLRNKPPKTDGPDRDLARQDFLDAVVEIRNLIDYAANRSGITDQIDEYSEQELSELYAETTNTAQKSQVLHELAKLFAPKPIDVQEAAE